MKNRRTFLMGLTCTAVTLGLVVGTALADELMGRITGVNVEEKTIEVSTKGSDEKITVKITDKTVVETPKGERPVNLERLKKGVEKSERGIRATITHEDKVASKIKMEFRKDGERKGGERKRGDREKEEARP